MADTRNDSFLRKDLKVFITDTKNRLGNALAQNNGEGALGAGGVVTFLDNLQSLQELDLQYFGDDGKRVPTAEEYFKYSEQAQLCLTGLENLKSFINNGEVKDPGVIAACEHVRDTVADKITQELKPYAKAKKPERDWHLTDDEKVMAEQVIRTGRAAVADKINERIRNAAESRAKRNTGWIEFPDDSRKNGFKGAVPYDVQLTGDVNDLAAYYVKNKNTLTADEKNYLTGRIGTAAYLNELEKNSKGQPSVPVFGVKKTGLFNNGVSLTGYEGKYQYQSTGNGCWSCAYAMLLESRGVSLNQQVIRSFRPDAGVNDMAETGRNLVKGIVNDETYSPFEMADLTLKVLPNSAMRQVGVQGYGPADFNNVKAQLKASLTEAIRDHKSPVALNNGSHFVTVVGINGDTLTVLNSLGTKNGLQETLSLDEAVRRNNSLTCTWIQDLAFTKEGTCTNLPAEYRNVRYSGGKLMNTGNNGDSLNRAGNTFSNTRMVGKTAINDVIYLPDSVPEAIFDPETAKNRAEEEARRRQEQMNRQPEPMPEPQPEPMPEPISDSQPEPMPEPIASKEEPEKAAAEPALHGKALEIQLIAQTYSESLVDRIGTLRNEENLKHAPGLNPETYLNALPTINRYVNGLNDPSTETQVTNEELREACNVFNADTLNRELEVTSALLQNGNAEAGIAPGDPSVSRYNEFLKTYSAMSTFYAQGQMKAGTEPPVYTTAPAKFAYDLSVAAPALDGAKTLYGGEIERDTSALLQNKEIKATEGAAAFLENLEVLQKHHAQQTEPPKSEEERVTDRQAKLAFTYLREHSGEIKARSAEMIRTLPEENGQYHANIMLYNIAAIYTDTVKETEDKLAASFFEREVAGLSLDTDSFRRELANLRNPRPENAEQAGNQAGQPGNQNVVLMDMRYAASEWEEYDSLLDMDDDDEGPAERENGLANELRYFANVAVLNKGPFDSVMAEMDRDYYELSDRFASGEPESLNGNIELSNVDRETKRLQERLSTYRGQLDFLEKDIRNKLHSALQDRGYEEPLKLADGLLNIAVNAPDEKQMRAAILREHVASAEETQAYLLDPNGKLPGKLLPGLDTNDLMKRLTEYSKTRAGYSASVEWTEKQLNEMKDYGRMRLLYDKRAMYATAHPAQYREYLQRKAEAMKAVRQAENAAAKQSDRYQIPEELRARDTVVPNEQRSAGVTGNIRETIRKYDRTAYDAFFRKLDTAENGELKLHHAIGAENAAAGRVISFNVAGSSFSEPLRYEKGLAGKSNIWMTDGTEKVHIRQGEDGHVYLYRMQDGKVQDLESYEVEIYAEKRLQEEFGKGGVLGLKDIRSKESDDGKKIKYSLSGPRLAWLPDKASGWLDAGDYQIEYTRKYIHTLGEQRLEELSKDEAFMKSDEPILFTFTGHSRGGVGALEGAMLLKHTIHEKYPQLENRIRFETLLYDPVPGPECRAQSSVNHAVNLKEQTDEMKKEGMDPFGENDHTTILYSIGCNHSMFFDPMKVIGADTVILTGHNHDEGLKDTEQQYDITRRKAYINAANGEAYRASGLCEVPNGLYISDENNVMVPIKDMDMAENVIKDVYPAAHGESRRVRRVNEVCTDMKLREGIKATQDAIVRGFNAHDPFYIISSREFAAMRAGFEDFTRMMKSETRDEVAIVRKMNEMKQQALDYLALKSGGGPYSNRTQGRISVARNIINFVDQTRAADLYWYAETELDRRPKTNDIREAYLENTQSSLDQNMKFMQRICEAYGNNQPVEAAFFAQTLSSMMADRFFLTHKNDFMPKPLTDTKEHPAALKQLDGLLGNGKSSLYEVFSNSSTVRIYVNDMLEKGDTLKVFSDPDNTMKYLDALNQMVSKEVAQKQKKPDVQKTAGKESAQKQKNKTETKKSETLHKEAKNDLLTR